jgi:hypothetical protein
MTRYTKAEAVTVPQLNTELEKIKLAIQDTLSRKGDTPNAMEGALDMNSNRVINVPNAVNAQEPVTLGQYLLSKEESAALKDAVFVDSIKDLSSVNTAANNNVFVRGFYTGTDVGGGLFYWDSTKDKTEHNGGTVLDPDRIDAWDGTSSNISTLFGPIGTGSGCFIRLYNNKSITPQDFGAVGNGVTNDTAAIQSAINSASPTNGLKLFFPAGEYLVASTLTIPETTAGNGILRNVIFEGESAYGKAPPGGSSRQRSIIKYSGSGALFDLTVGTPTSSGVRSNCSWRNISLVGSGETGTYAIKLDRCIGSYFFNLIVDNFEYGIDENMSFLGHGYYTTFDNVEIKNCTQIGLTIARPNATTLRNLVIQNCTTGLRVQSASTRGVVVLGGAIERCVTAVFVDQARQIDFYGTYFEDNDLNFSLLGTAAGEHSVSFQKSVINLVGVSMSIDGFTAANTATCAIEVKVSRHFGINMIGCTYANRSSNAVSIVKRVVDGTIRSARVVSQNMSCFDISTGLSALPLTNNLADVRMDVDPDTRSNYYEKGTFTPLIRGSSTAGSYPASDAVGEYVFNGDICYFNLRYVVDTASGGTGNLRLDIPLGIKSIGGSTVLNATVFLNGIPFTGDYVVATRNGATSVVFDAIANTGVVTRIPISAVGAGNIISIQGSFERE